MQFVVIALLASLCLSMLLFKSMLIRIMIMIVVFPLVVLYLYIQELPLVGILELNRQYFSSYTLDVAFYSYLGGAILFILLLLPLRKKEFEIKESIRIDPYLHTLIFLMYIIGSYSLLQIRTESGGSASLYLTFSILLLYFNKGFLNIFTILHIMYTLFIMSMGERVDSILVLVYLLIMNNIKGINKESYNKFLLYIGLAGIFIIGIIVAFGRTGSSYDINSILISLYAQQTITDVLYVYLCGVDYYLSFGFDISVLANAIFGLFPGPFYGAGSDYNYTFFLINNYATNPGGGMFFTEAILAFGPLGVPLYLGLLALVIKKIFKSSKPAANILFILTFILFCRIVWYGVIYTYKPIILVLVMFYFVKRIKITTTKYLK